MNSVRVATLASLLLTAASVTCAQCRPPATQLCCHAFWDYEVTGSGYYHQAQNETCASLTGTLYNAVGWANANVEIANCKDAANNVCTAGNTVNQASGIGQGACFLGKDLGPALVNFTACEGVPYCAQLYVQDYTLWLYSVPAPGNTHTYGAVSCDHVCEQ